MFVHYVTGDLTKVSSGVIAHGCNAQKKMNSGVAKSIRSKFPGAYAAYMDSPSILGSVSWHKAKDNLHVANMITQRFYGYDGSLYLDYDAFRESFEEVILFCKSEHLPLSIPKIGCGLGGGSWNDVCEIIDDVCYRACYNSANITVYTLEGTSL